MATVSIQQAYEPVEVDLWGTVFKTIPATRSITQKLDEALAKIDAAGTSDSVIEAGAELLDIRLSPVKEEQPAVDGKPAKRPKVVKASDVLKKKWREDAVTIPQFFKLLDDLDAADRPT